VADTGIGVPRDKQEAIFEEFRQADNSTTRVYGAPALASRSARGWRTVAGPGLVESEEGEGSTFHFTVLLRKDIELRSPAPVEMVWEEHANAGCAFWWPRITRPTETCLRPAR